MSRSPLPKVIFFDAVGTLFDVRGSVGEVYQSVAQKFGVKIDGATLSQSFRASFSAAPPPVFSTVEVPQLKQQEFAWWKAVVKATFTTAGVFEQFSDFNAFFAELYRYFATKEPWYIYSEVFPTLQHWRQQEVELGIISNFDTRLYQLLKQLNLAQFFGSITVSSSVGAAKPNKHIFLAALAKHNCLPQQAWHVGDSLTDDYQGAKKVGIKAFWLNRFESSIMGENQLPNLSSLG